MTDPRVRKLAGALAAMVTDDGTPRPGSVLEQLLAPEVDQQEAGAAALHRYARHLLDASEEDTVVVLERLARTVDFAPGVVAYIERLARHVGAGTSPTGR